MGVSGLVRAGARGIIISLPSLPPNLSGSAPISLRSCIPALYSPPSLVEGHEARPYPQLSSSPLQGDWSGIMFDHMAWRTTGTCILCCLDDIQLLLDSQIGKTQSMRASPYIETASLASRHRIALCRLQDWPACGEPIHVPHQ